jgi:hypothetical protein
MPIRLKVMRSVFITLAAVMALAGCGGGGNESASSTSSTASNTAKTNWTRFGYDYCSDAIVANGGLSSRSSNFPGDAVKTAVFGMGATVADEKQVITGCNRAYREAVRTLEGREIDDWYGDGNEDCRGDLENGGGFNNPSRESFAEEARAVGAVGDEVEQYADGCQAAYDEFASPRNGGTQSDTWYQFGRDYCEEQSYPGEAGTPAEGMRLFSVTGLQIAADEAGATFEQVQQAWDGAEAAGCQGSE